jgi:hypothetical protein
VSSWVKLSRWSLRGTAAPRRSKGSTRNLCDAGLLGAGDERRGVSKKLDYLDVVTLDVDPFGNAGASCVS